ncbi:MAG: ComF family protein [Anaerolineales bacterium]|nr:ComF family protein [Anaerolineales bacterium]
MGAWLCDACQQRAARVAPPFCTRCGDAITTGELCPRCQVTPLRLDCVRSAFYFEGVVRDTIHEFKYNGVTVLAEPLSDLMARYWHDHPLPADVLVPVALHKARLRERGYNQAELLARALGRRIGLPVNTATLVRQRATAPQVELDMQERKRNVEGAFEVHGQELTGRKVLLLDDVCTTAATLDACAAALRDGGVESVAALTLARAR